MKAHIFEYITYLLICWYKERKGIHSDMTFNEQNDISKLKVLKLLFFVVAVNAKKNSLLDVFTFSALPYGHVEDDIYTLIDVNGLQRYTIDRDKTIIRPEYQERLEDSFRDLLISVEHHQFEAAKTAVKELQIANPSLIEDEAFDLVEISHLWFSWRSMFAYARAKGRFREPIPGKLIEQDNKIFSLS